MLALKWLRSNLRSGWFRPLLFGFKYLLLLGLCFGFMDTSFYQVYIFPFLSSGYALAVYWVTDFLGFDTYLKSADSISLSNKFTLFVGPGCDGVAVMLLFLLAALIFPAPLHKKIKGILIFLMVVPVLNVFRMVALLLIGGYDHFAFVLFHDLVQPVVIILAGLWIWIGWVRWTLK